jgi:hypothetical protein
MNQNSTLFKHVHDPNGTVEVKTVMEHELPWEQRLALERLNRTIKSEYERSGVKDGWGRPVDPHLVQDGSDVDLSWEEQDHAAKC